MYGVIDTGISYISNQKVAGSTAGHNNFALTNYSTNPDLFGLRGSEDPGGDLKAIFTLGNGFTPANGELGQHGVLFGHQAFAGLSSNEVGTVTLGRQYDAMVEYLAPLAAASVNDGGELFGHPYDNDNLENTMRINNSVKYTSVEYGGWRFANQVNLQLDYALSKRTDVYVEGQFQHVSGGGNVFTADIYGLAPSANDKQLAVTAGVRTQF